MKTELAQYLELKNTEDISPVVLREAAKVVLRGKIIAFASAKKRLRENKCIELEKQIKQLEQKHKSQLTTNDLTQLGKAKRALGSLLRKY